MGSPRESRAVVDEADPARGTATFDTSVQSNCQQKKHRLHKCVACSQDLPAADIRARLKFLRMGQRPSSSREGSRIAHVEPKGCSGIVAATADDIADDVRVDDNIEAGCHDGDDS